MRIHVDDPKTEHEQHYVLVLVDDPLPEVPGDFLIITNAKPDEHPIRTSEQDHTFRHSTGEFGFPAELVTTARLFTAGEIDKTTATQAITAVLTRWSDATHGRSERWKAGAGA
jgi:hypothetical protein